MNEQEKEFLILAVKLLFRKINEGKVTFAKDKVPQTLKALEEVAFNDKDNPVFETIKPPVRALANIVIAQEEQRIEEEALEREKKSPAHEFLVNPVPVTEEILEKCKKEGRYSGLAFDLFKETGCVLSVCAHSYLNEKPQGVLMNRNQAVCAGLLIRIVKFMLAVVQLSAETNRGEVVLALNRSIIESTINLRFLILKNEQRFFDQFIKFSLAPERELYDIIKQHIQDQGGNEMPIQTRMLRSIQRTCDLSGFKVEEIDPKHGDWGGGLRNRVEALGQSLLYVVGQRILSHAVHGTWVDLLLHHLEEKDGGFVPKPDWLDMDAKLLYPTCQIVLEGGSDYLMHFIGDLPEVKPLYSRIDDLQERILKLDTKHEEWLGGPIQ